MTQCFTAIPRREKRKRELLGAGARGRFSTFPLFIDGKKVYRRTGNKLITMKFYFYKKKLKMPSHYAKLAENEQEFKKI